MALPNFLSSQVFHTVFMRREWLAGGWAGWGCGCGGVNAAAHSCLPPLSCTVDLHLSRGVYAELEQPSLELVVRVRQYIEEEARCCWVWVAAVVQSCPRAL